MVEVFEVTLTVAGSRRALEVRFNSRSSAPVLPVVTDRGVDPGQFAELLNKYDLDPLAEAMPGLLDELATTPNQVRYRADLRSYQWVPDIRRVMDGPVIKGGPAAQPVTKPDVGRGLVPRHDGSSPQPEPQPAPPPAPQPEPLPRQSHPTPQPHHEPTPVPEPAPQAADPGVLERVDQLHSRMEPLERLAETVADHQRALNELLSLGAGELSEEQLAALKEQLKDDLGGSPSAEQPGPELPLPPGLNRDEVLALVEQKVEGLQAELGAVREELAAMEQRLGQGGAQTEASPGGLDLAALQAEAEALLADHEHQLQRSLEPLQDAVAALVSPLDPDRAESLTEQLDRWIQGGACEDLDALRQRQPSALQEVHRLLQIGALLRGNGKTPASRPTALALKIARAVFEELGELPADLTGAMEALAAVAGLDWILPAPGDAFNARLHDVKGKQAADVPKNSVAILLCPGALDREGGAVVEKAQVLVAS